MKITLKSLSRVEFQYLVGHIHHVPCEIIHAGLKVDFEEVEGNTIKGMYQLKGSNVWDSALTFTADMYKKGQHMCVSFTGSV